MSSDLCLQRHTMEVVDEPQTDNLGRSGRFSGSLDDRSTKPLGQGRMEYEDEVYEGQWVDGDWSGFGKIVSRQTGNIFEGSFLDNKKHGLGVISYADGRIFDGTFQLDRRMGKGRMIYVDGSTYWGNWSNDSLRHGRGKLTLPDGSIYDGEFDNGSIEGHGRMTLPDGRWYLGEWTDGKKNGIGLEVTAGGLLSHEGTFCNDFPVICSSFPHRRKSTTSCLVYRSSSTGTRKALVGPIPRDSSMRHLFNHRLQ
jgi:hypothetical protein